MSSKYNYIYGWKLLEDDPSLKERLTNEEIYDLEKREEPVYYFSDISTVPSYSHDNRLQVFPKDAIDYRYEVHKKLGKGAFGNVYHCTDHKRNFEVAIKVVRNERRFHKQALIEKEIYELMCLPSNNSNKEYVINLLKSFTFRGNVFFVFPCFGMDLYHYYRSNAISMNDVKAFGCQITRGLAFIHSYGIIHMDLKPENILIRDKHLKIIDLGSAIVKPDNKKLFKDYIQSRYYRSPEVIYNLEINEKIDIWSLGCILYEMAVRKPLFPARTTSELVIYHIHVLGYPITSEEEIYENQKIFTKSKELRSFRLHDGRFLYPNDFKWPLSIADNVAFRNLLKTECLLVENKRRATAEEILEHPFFN